MSERFDAFLRQLRLDLARLLPGHAAQYLMAPRPRPGAEFYDSPRPDSRRGGVLALFYPFDDTVYLPLILRPTYPGVHSGQVGFPGGHAIAGAIDPRNDIGKLQLFRLEIHGGALGGQVHNRALHAIQFLEVALDRGNTVGAGHACDR